MRHKASRKRPPNPNEVSGMSCGKNDMMKNTQAIEKYLRNIELDQGYSQNTIKLYRKALNNFAAFLKSENIEVLTEKKLLAYREHVEKAQESYKTKNLRMIPVRRFLAFLISRDIIDIDIRKVEPFKNRNGGKKMELPSNEAMQKFLAITTPENLESDMLANLVYATGLRLSEVCSLKAGQVQETFSITGKGGKPRFIVCDPSVLPLVRSFEEKRGLVPGDPLMGIVRRSVQKIIERRAREHNLKLSIHTLRHCCATNLLERGMDIRAVQEFLGHASLATTQIYTHISNDHLLKSYRDAMKK